jgi:hypothetical protein
MATKVKVNSSGTHSSTPKVKRPGIHAKTKSSVSKNAKNYTKNYVGQGK